MNITDIDKNSDCNKQHIYSSVTINDSIHILGLNDDRTIFEFECYKPPVNEDGYCDWDFEQIKALAVYHKNTEYSNLTFDDFTLAHMTNSMNVSMKDLDVIWLMYCYMFDENKSEQDFKLELTELLK